MLDFGQLGFDWDDGNSSKSLDKHGVSQQGAEQVFVDPRVLVFVDEKHSGEEQRFHAYGRTALGRLLEVSFTLRQDETLISVISSRNMSRKERTRYEQET
jgi:uncharacterized DUF497 family protein